jgi:hypothetical protein
VFYHCEAGDQLIHSAYSGYLIFFHEEVARLGPVGVLEEYIFSPHAVSSCFWSCVELILEL